MTVKEKQAIELHDKHYNCCQSVILPFAEELGADYETVFRLTEAYGLGLGGKEGSCGAVLGACAAAGLLNSNIDYEGVSSKPSTNGITAELTRLFEEHVGSLKCKEIRGEDTGEPLMPCADCILYGVKLVEDLLAAKES